MCFNCKMSLVLVSKEEVCHFLKTEARDILVYLIPQLHLESSEKLQSLVTSLIQGIKKSNVISLHFLFILQIVRKIIKDKNMQEQSLLQT